MVFTVVLGDGDLKKDLLRCDWMSRGCSWDFRPLKTSTVFVHEENARFHEAEILGSNYKLLKRNNNVSMQGRNHT